MSRHLPRVLAAGVAVSAAVLSLASGAQAGQLKEVARIPIMLDVPLNGFDIGYVDQKTDTVYFTSSAHFFDPKVIHPGNNVLLVIDAKTNKLIKAVPGFKHPSGVVVTKSGAEAWVSDGDSTVKVVDLKAGKITDTISTGGTDRADEVAYDPRDHVFAVANGDDDPPFLTLISTEPGHKIIAKVPVPEGTDGLEQTIYQPKDGMFYTDVPELNKEHAKGAMLKTDPKTGKRVALLPVDNCRPHGNAIGLGTDLILGCNAGNTRNKDTLAAQQAIFDTATGKVTYIPGAGGTDMSAADDKLGQYYTASVGNPDPGPVLAVIDAKTAKIIQKIPTAGLAHSVAVDTNNHHVFVPSAGGDFGGCGCVLVYAPQ
jgi:YVTN family beta-propeller protein